ncbi:CHASE domain-containing protein [Thioalkalivibrio paradoxus]|uniref:Histidine kinase n=1 Tax=Thioalkalivibrio paradoxus ARh 1 TaxID=713585 RepID=W0DTK9_9GAMM|nr:CHASE domain-containing protein [Thioalkalivibrio paradoxus]AHF00329.1 hypothetical protein THITH_17190 [Thioalkalivibrio paradoxus ARh 1]
MTSATGATAIARSTGRARLMLASAWIAVTLAVAWALFHSALQAVDQTASKHAEALRGTLADRAMLSDAVIEGLAAALRIGPGADPSATRDYAESILARYPHIYLLGAARVIPHAERADLESGIHAGGVAPSGLRYFDYQGDRRWHPVPDKALYYPMLMVEPESDATRAILGLDLDAVPLFRPALRQAYASDGPVMVGPFEMTTGQRAIALVRTVCAKGSDRCENGDGLGMASHVAVLAVLAEAIIDCGGLAANGYSCAVWVDDGTVPRNPETLLAEQPAAYDGSRVERWLLPRTEHRLAISGTSQPLNLEVSRQLTRDAINFQGILALLLLSGAGLAIALRLQARHERSEQARADTYRALREERASLEHRVQERTAELSEINTALERENRARQGAEDALRRKGMQLRLLARRLMDAQEQERRTLARELHDDIGQTLTALRTHAQLIRQQHRSPDHPCARSASTIFDLAGALYDSAHRIMRRLRPRALDELGPVEALQACIDAAGLEAMGIEVHTELRGQLEDLDDAVTVAVYRLLQEALTNVVRHADARSVRVEVARDAAGIPSLGYPEGDSLRLRVEDDGQGMPEQALDKDRLGLLGAQERVEALGGRFLVERSAAGGVLLRAEIPLNRRLSR